MTRSRLFLALLLCLSLLAAPSFAAVKAGTKCTKVGATSVSGGKKFTCVKSGSKLVWNKGVAAKTSAKTNLNPTVKPSTPTPTPSPIASVQPTPTPTPTSTPKNIQTLIEEFNKYPLRAKPAPPLLFLIGSNADPILAQEIEVKSRQSFSLWTDFYDDIRPYPILYGSDKDMDWLFSEWRKLGYTNPDHIAEVKSRVAQGGFGAVLYMRDQGTWSNLIPRGKEPTFGSLRTNWINHHVVHAVQQRITGEQYDLLPCWGIEGGAEFYGLLTSNRLHGVDYLAYRQTLMGNWKGTKPDIDLRLFSQGQWLELLSDFDSRGRGCSDALIGNLHYSVGFLINEVLMADYGHEKIIRWWQSLKQNNDWTIGFQEIFGISHNTWYRNRVVPYLLEQYELWTPQPGWG